MCGISCFVACASCEQANSSLSNVVSAIHFPTNEEISENILRRGPDIQGSLSLQHSLKGCARQDDAKNHPNDCLQNKDWAIYNNSKNSKNSNNSNNSNTGGRDNLLTLFGSVLHLRGENDSPTQQPVRDNEGNILVWNGEVFGGKIEVKERENDTAVILRELGKCETKASVLLLLEEVQGPFSFIYFQKRTNSLFYGRDKLGRRSLIVQFFGSISCPFILISSVSLPSLSSSSSVKEIETGGIFCMNLNSGTVEMMLWSYVSTCLPSIAPVHPSFFHCSPFLTEEIVPSLSCAAPEPQIFGVSLAATLVSVLAEAVRLRVANIPHSTAPGQANVGLLFSGGVDCMVLAALADRFLSPEQSIDLINVAFVGDFAGHEDFLLSTIPDRATAVNGYLELKELSPERQFRLIQVDMTLTDLMEYRLHILHLLTPCTTIMDFNIGSVLWFGARAQGALYNGSGTYLENEFCRYSSEDDTTEKSENEVVAISIPVGPPPSHVTKTEYTSHCRVILNGLGADELMAGYGRHRTTFRKLGSEHLQQELNKDLRRLWRRNLGRDDRLISDHGREVRHPYLDENFIDFIQRTALSDLCDLSLPSGVGDKKILREAAKLLGLSRASCLEKRAMQFGTRIANNKVAGYVEMNAEVVLLDVVNPHMLRIETTISYCQNDRCANFVPCLEHELGTEKSSKRNKKAAAASSQRRKTASALSKNTNRKLGKPGYEF